MLQHDLEAEKKIAKKLRATFKEAIELGDIATSYLTQELTYNTEDRAQHVLHFLEADRLDEELRVAMIEETK